MTRKERNARYYAKRKERLKTPSELFKTPSELFKTPSERLDAISNALDEIRKRIEILETQKVEISAENSPGTE